MNHRGALPVSFPSGNRMPQRLRRWRLRHAIGAAELAHWWPLSLSRRIVVTVTLGLGFILLLSGVLVEWTIRESTRAAFDDRVRLAQDFAQRVDDVVISAQASIEDESAHLQIDPNQGLTAAAQQRLTELLARDNGFNRVVITDVNGRIWWQGSSPHGALDAPLDPLAAHMALDTRQTQRGLCSSSQSSIAPLVCFSVPLSDSTGATSAVLAAVFDPTAVPTYSLFTAAAFTPTTTDGINVGLFDTAGSSPIPTSGSPSLFGAEHRRLLAPFIGTASAGYAIHRPVSGPMHVVVYAPVPTLPSWGVVLEEPRDHVVTLPDQLRQRLALFGAVVLVLAMGLAWTDVRRVVGPLRHLTAAAEQFAAGHLEQPIRLNRGDELGILAGAFETMRLRLRASLNEVETWNQELEQRVARRTSEVEARNHELASLNALAETVGGYGVRVGMDPALKGGAAAGQPDAWHGRCGLGRAERGPRQGIP